MILSSCFVRNSNKITRWTKMAHVFKLEAHFNHFHLYNLALCNATASYSLTLTNEVHWNESTESVCDLLMIIKLNEYGDSTSIAVLNFFYLKIDAFIRFIRGISFNRGEKMIHMHTHTFYAHGQLKAKYISVSSSLRCATHHTCQIHVLLIKISWKIKYANFALRCDT